MQLITLFAKEPLLFLIIESTIEVDKDEKQNKTKTTTWLIVNFPKFSKMYKTC